RGPGPRDRGGARRQARGRQRGPGPRDHFHGHVAAAFRRSLSASPRRGSSLDPVAHRLTTCVRLPNMNGPSSLRVFIVENHEDTLKWLAIYLESVGHRVQSARSVHEALEALRTADLDVLISDIGLPDGDGWELLRRAGLPAHIYAIAMSGFGTQGDRV